MCSEDDGTKQDTSCMASGCSVEVRASPKPKGLNSVWGLWFKLKEYEDRTEDSYNLSIQICTCVYYIYIHYKLYLACLKLVMVRGISVDFGFREPFSSL